MKSKRFLATVALFFLLSTLLLGYRLITQKAVVSKPTFVYLQDNKSGPVSSAQIYLEKTKRTIDSISTNADSKYIPIDSPIKSYVDKVVEALNIAENIQAKQALRKDTVKQLRTENDSLRKEVRRAFTNKFLNLTIKSPDGDTSAIDTSALAYKYNVSLNKKSFEKNKRIFGLRFGRKVTETVFTLNDPNATIDGKVVYSERVREKFASGGIQLIGNYNWQTRAPSVGIGFQFNTGKVGFRVAGYYNLSTQSVSPSTQIQYELLSY